MRNAHVDPASAVGMPMVEADNMARSGRAGTCCSAHYATSRSGAAAPAVVEGAKKGPWEKLECSRCLQAAGQGCGGGEKAERAAQEVEAPPLEA